MGRPCSDRYPGKSRLCIVACLLLPGVVSATTWHVTYDPAQPEDRVGAVAALAASGDSILIDPGTYYEHIPLEGKSLTFIGIDGAGVTILDGSRALPDREGSIIYTLTGAPADLTICGLTLQNGTGTPYPEITYYEATAGGGILWWERNVGFSASLVVTDCVLRDNTTGAPWEGDPYQGGGIFAGSLESVDVLRSEFSGNLSDGGGSDIQIAATRATVAECSFQVADGNSYGASCIGQSVGQLLRIERCVFLAEQGDGQHKSIRASPINVEIVDNRFLDINGPLATCVWVVCDFCAEPLPQDVLISGNVFWNAAGPDSTAEPTVLIGADGAVPVLRNNTFDRCGIEISTTMFGGPLVFEGNLVARGQVRSDVPRGGDYSCNDFWRSRVTDYAGNLTHANNITDNPFFCDEAGGGFTLSEGSPCAPSGSCDLIGAEPVACDLDIHACCVGQECVLATEEECSDLGGHWMIDPPLTSCEPDPCLTPARKTTWGAMKALFRGDAK